MKGKHKPFEPDLYTQYDGPAKQAMRVHLELTGHTVTVPPENYGPDLYSIYFHRKMFHEVEVCRVWHKHEHPFFTGSIPERKQRLLTKIGDCDLFFWMLRTDLRRALVFPHTVMATDEWLVEVSNVKIESGEYFFRPPKNLGKEFDLACL